MTRTRREWQFDLGVALILMLALHGASLLHGELRGDDYIFLREGRLPLAATLLHTWGGHLFPLWRAEGALVSRWWGAHAAPFRWWLFAQVALLAFLQARVLAVWGLSRGARFIALVVLCGWTQWAQVTMGYWTLSITVKVWIATSLAILAVIGSEKPGAARKALIALAAFAAILEDSTGAIVVPAVFCAALASGLRRGLRGRELVRRVEWPAAVAFICTVIFLLGQSLVHLEAQELLGAIGGGSFVKEAVYLLGVGTVGMLFAPVFLPQLPHRAVDALGVLLSLAVVFTIWRTWRRGSRDERAPLGFTVALFAFGLVMIVGARPYLDYYFMVGWTHYMTFLYIPVAAMIAVAWDQARRTGAWRPEQEVRWLAVTAIVFLSVQEAAGAVDARKLIQAGRRWEQRDALLRRDMIATLRDSLFTPLAAIVPPGGRVPQMLSTSLDVRYPRLHPLFPLSFYDEAGGARRGRFRWIAPAYANGETYDGSDATTVSHMKGVVDPAFTAALHNPSWWRDTYFATTPLEPTPMPAFACDAVRRSADPMRGDADRRHWLLLDARGRGSAAALNVTVRTDFRSAASYSIDIAPQLNGCARVELLGLPELALSDRIEILGANPTDATRVVLVGLFPPAAARRAR